jgi:hypothetical protein
MVVSQHSAAALAHPVADIASVQAHKLNDSGQRAAAALRCPHLLIKAAAGDRPHSTQHSKQLRFVVCCLLFDVLTSIHSHMLPALPKQTGSRLHVLNAVR